MCSADLSIIQIHWATNPKLFFWFLIKQEIQCQIFKTTSSGTIVHKKTIFEKDQLFPYNLTSGHSLGASMYSRAFPHTRVTRYTARSSADQNTIKALANFCPFLYFYGLKSGLSDTLKTACKLGRVSRHGLEPKSRKYMRWLLDGCTSDFFLLLYFFRFLFSVK